MLAVRVPAPSQPLAVADVPIPDPGPGAVRIRVEASGVCHSDAATVYGAFPGIAYPRVPGHEIAGTIDALGAGVEGWQRGDRVGVGWHGGHDGVCDRCRRGDFITCRHLQIPGISYDGGYAEYVVAPVVALARIPQELSAVEAAPLMCAGITTFNALRHSPARAGDVVAVLGIGGLGHLGVQYAAKMGFHTVAIARGADKRDAALAFGAHSYIDSTATNVGAALLALGGAKVVLSTVTAPAAMEAVLGGLAVDGELLIVGAAQEPLTVNSASMIFERHGLRAWPSGTCVDSEDTMRFSVLTGVRAQTETRPLAEAAQAFDYMMSGKARFRVVLTV
jgi:D-arabinose 1-dehydrogenase-like Zn-dependent alcohol dehydrogenase